MFFLPALMAGLGGLGAAGTTAAAPAFAGAAGAGLGAAGTAAGLSALPAAATGLAAIPGAAGTAAGMGAGAAGTAAGMATPALADMALGSGIGSLSAPAAAGTTAIGEGLNIGVNAALNPGAALAAGGVNPSLSSMAMSPTVGAATPMTGAAPITGAIDAAANPGAALAAGGVEPSAAAIAGGAPLTDAAAAAAPAAEAGGGLGSYLTPNNLMLAGGAASLLTQGMGGGGEEEEEGDGSYKEYKPWSKKYRDTGPGYSTKRGEHRYFAEGGGVFGQGGGGESQSPFQGATIEQIFGGSGPGAAFGGSVPLNPIQQEIMRLQKEGKFAEGGPVGGNERDVVGAAVEAIKGQSQDPKGAIAAFIAQFGATAFERLMAEVKGQGNEPREIVGPGDGTSDDIPAQIDGKEPAALSSGEFVVPADVVSGLGNGDTKAGIAALHDMMNRIRSMKTGAPQQPPDVSTQDVMPA